MGRYLKLMCVILTVVIICGCSAEDRLFIIPADYTAEALVKVYTDKSEYTYNVKILCRDGNYNLTIQEENASWNVAFLADKRCILNNARFPESSVTIENFNIAESLITEFDFSKFNNSLDPVPEELIYWDGTYKHVLTFSKENLLPKTIFIYKNDNLVKAIQYDKINIEQ